MECDAHQYLSPVALDHAQHPRNNGPLADFTGHARITGPCGDTMEFWLLVRDRRIEKVSFVTDGCGPSHACGSMATCLIEGKSVEQAAAITQKDVLDALGDLPEKYRHCALLAANTLRAACEDSMEWRSVKEIKERGLP
jgi:nitrogen fixation NifU-like protein